MWKCPKCGLELEDSVLICPCGEPRPEEEIKEETPSEAAPVEEVIAKEAVTEETAFEEAEEYYEELTEEEPYKKPRNKKLITLISAIVIIVLLTAGIFSYYLINRNVKVTGEYNSITTEDINKACDSILGDKIAIKVDGLEVDEDIFQYYADMFTFNYLKAQAYDKDGNFDENLIKNFNWNETLNSETKETHKQFIMTNLINFLVDNYTVLSMGEKHGVEISEEYKALIKENMQQYKDMKEDELEEFLESVNCESLKHVEKIITLQVKLETIQNDMMQNPLKYVTKDMSDFNFESLDDLVYYAKRTSKIHINKSMFEDYDIDIDTEEVIESIKAEIALTEAEAEAEATDGEE